MEGKLFLGRYLIWVMLVLGELHGYRSCIEKERMALLEFKKYIISITVEWDLDFADFVLHTWTNDTKSNCCRWEGVTCNRTSRRVMGLSTGIPNLKYHSLLNLSLLHPFEELRSLNLSGNYFNGLFDYVEGYKSLGRLRNLEILDLSSNEFNNSIFPFLNAATSLTTLFLRDNYMMDGPFPVKELKDLTNLELLDLSGNMHSSIMGIREFPYLKALDLSDNIFSSSVELQELKDLTNLEVLGLARNLFHGPIPTEAFCEMKNIRELDLRGNYFVHQLPMCLGSLNMLRFLDLSSNELSGNIPSSFSNLKSLEYLSLLDNNFEGFFSLNPLENLTKLKVFKLSSKSDMVLAETESTWMPKFQLNVAILRFCNLEKIPSFLAYQKKLRLVDLSSNRLSGNIPTWLVENNPELVFLQLKNNTFTIFQMHTLLVHTLQFMDFSENDIGGQFPDNFGRVLPNLVYMNGSGNGFQGNMPSSMGEMKKISYLDLSYNNFSGELPRSFLMGCFSLTHLKLSYNRFSGPLLPRATNFTFLSVLRMDNNLFTGKMGVGLRTLISLSMLDISNNHLTGAIPSWISDLFFDSLSISNNFLEGAISPSLLAIPNLNFLDVSGNLLSGALQSDVHCIEGAKWFLNNNNFTGPIPDTLLGNVSILDLRNNKLSGSIPQFVNTRNLSILLLRGNNLTGSIPRHLCDLSNIRLLDLSHNKFSGFIPSCLSNLSFGMGGEGLNIYSESSRVSIHFVFYKFTFVAEEFVFIYGTYTDIEIKFAAKQRYDSYTGESEFSGGTLDYMHGLDLSSNELSGAIPAELGDLSSLRALNLSHNYLSSSIPDIFSQLNDIESLDLSYNMLQGRIPHQLTNLTSLAVFNVSYNNLSGIIPQGRQFSTFNENSYLGNPLLCGPPTNLSCEAKKNTEEADNGGEEDDDEAVVDMLVFYWSTASTYVTALIGFLLLMCIDCSWRRAWLRLVDAFIASAKSMIS